MSEKAFYQLLLGGALSWTALFIMSAFSRRGVLAMLCVGVVYFSCMLIALLVMWMNGVL